MHLARYFGDADVVPNGKCKTCTHCTTGKAVSFTPSSGSTVPDQAKVKAILNACAERDDPRLLARFAFGVTSPRLTANKLTSYHPLFGSMVVRLSMLYYYLVCLIFCCLLPFSGHRIWCAA